MRQEDAVLVLFRMREVVLFIEQVIRRENRAPGAIGLVCSVVGLAVFGADNMVIPAMVLTLIVLLAGRRKLCA